MARERSGARLADINGEPIERDVGVMNFPGPLYVVWEVTLLCNLRCLHCYSGAATRHPDEFSTEEAEDVIRQLSDIGVIILGFSGGEPLLRKDWRRLVRLAVDSGMLVSIGTNGTTVTPRIAHELRDLGVHSVCVSLDGATFGIHEQVRQKKGLFPRTITAIDRLVDAGVRVVVGYTPVRYNVQDARSVVDLAYQLGASAVNLSEFVPTGRGTLYLCLRPDELHQVIDTWAACKTAHQGGLEAARSRGMWLLGATGQSGSEDRSAAVNMSPTRFLCTLAAGQIGT